MVENLPANAGDARDAVLTPESGRSPRGGNGNPLQHSCLERSMDRGAWRPSPWDHKELGTTERLNTHSHTCTHTHTRLNWSRCVFSFSWMPGYVCLSQPASL